MAESAKVSKPIVDALANAKGSHLTNPSKPWHDIRTKAKIPDLRLHDLRHHFAIVGAGGGPSLYQVGNLLGHTQAVMTQRCAKVAKLTTKKGSQ